MKGTRFLICLLLNIFMVCLNITTGLSQIEDEKGPEYWMDEIVVVGERTHNLLLESTVAVSILTSSTLQQLPTNNLAGALKYIPGLTFIERDGSGNTPIAIARGFFGGGETDYVLLTIDGVPANDMRTGLAEWSQIPLSSVERIEVLRGGGSAVYGDAALGAVINVITHKSKRRKEFSANFVFGEDRYISSDVSFQVRLGRQRINMRAYGNRTDGYRSHSDWNTILLTGQYDYQFESENSFSMASNIKRSNQDYPGPLTVEQIADDRRQVNPLFEQDYNRRDLLEANFSFCNPSEKRKHYTADFGFRSVDQEQTRTILLKPDYGDTQFHDERNSTIWSRAQLNHKAQSYSVMTGVDADFGYYESQYFDKDNRDNLISGGTGNRLRFGLYLEAQKKFGNRFKTMAGLRYDFIDDRFEDNENIETSVDFDQWTPRLGLNYAYLTNQDYTGHIYSNWTHSFKVPTLDQLFDQRKIAVGPPGQFISISNEQLQPQLSNGFEIGIYQKVSVYKNLLYVELTISGYRIDLEDEIDFDLNTFMYGNINESRHDGIESTVSIYLLPVLSINTSLNFMDVKFESQENNGNRLKLIPEKSISSYLNIFTDKRVRMTLTHNYTSEVYLDDENTTKLPSYQTFDAKLQVDFNQFRFFVTVNNIANEKYNSSGYLLFDPVSMSKVQLLFPARERYLESGAIISF